MEEEQDDKADKVEGAVAASENSASEK